MKKHIFSTLILGSFLLVFSQSVITQVTTDTKEIDRREECVVYYFDDISKVVDLDDEDEELKKAEIGRFFATGGEGTNIVKKFRIGKSKLFIVASVFYEDDLFYGRHLHDAITLRISAGNSEDENDSKSYLAFGNAHSEYTRYFGAASVAILFSQKKRQSSAEMQCKNLNPVSPFEDEDN